MRTNVSFTNDSEYDCWTVSVTFKGKESMEELVSLFEELIEYIKKNSSEDIECCNCPWDYEGTPNEFGDTFTLDKGWLNKSEFMDEMRMLVRNWKKSKK